MRFRRADSRQKLTKLRLQPESLEERRLLTADLIQAWESLASLPAPQDASAQAYIQPNEFAAVSIDTGRFSDALADAPTEFTPAARQSPAVISLPNPEGEPERFNVWKSPVMAPELAAKYPEIQTFAGQGIDDPTATVRFDITPAGFHAQVLGVHGSYLIDPYYHLEDSAYISYYRADLQSDQVFQEGLSVASADGTLSGLYGADDYQLHDDGSVSVTDSANGDTVIYAAGTYHLHGDGTVHVHENAEPDASGGGCPGCGGMGCANCAPAVVEHGSFASSLVLGGGQTSGTELRTYRAAVAATGEYTTFHGGTVALGQAAIVSAINRVNQIYENELSIRMELVANNDSLVYTNAATDPYSGSVDSAQLTLNDTNIDNVIGSSNYDIGHFFTQSTGGLAGLGVVGTAFKGRGGTGRPTPIGDPFWVDFVAHEMGHQFGAQHTFNGLNQPMQGSCDTANHSPNTAVEPGSGSTIMAYAGICVEENIQANSDPVFHVVSFDQIVNFVDNVIPSVGTRTATGNSVPTIDAGPDYTIPANTPFELTATASDPNFDSITYHWEQTDTGPQRDYSTLTDDGQGPIARSLVPNVSNIRSFPNSTQFNTYPLVDRTLNFRATARDNRAGGGGVASDGMVVTAVDTGAPFVVTSEPGPSGNPWTGRLRNITWNVAGTDANGIDADFVDIKLSLNAGDYDDYVLAYRTPNDGSHILDLPGEFNGQGTILVQASDNIFYDFTSGNGFINTNGQPDPNDQISEAFILGVGDSYQGAMSSGTVTDVDMFGFSAAAGQHVGFDIDTFNSGLDARIRLFDSSGNQLATNDDGVGPGAEDDTLESYLEYTFPTQTTYYVGISYWQNTNYNPSTGGGDTPHVTGSALGTYTLDVLNLGVEDNGTIATSSSLVLGDTALGQIDPAVEVDMASFSATGGQEVTISAEVTSGNLDAYLRIFDGSGNELASDAGFPNASVGFLVPSNGTYYVGVSGNSNQDYNPVTGSASTGLSGNFDDTGNYTLRLSGDASLVNTTLDVVAVDGLTSLREAINAANTNLGVNFIDFDPGVFSTPQTIALNSELTITDHVWINGPGADLLTIDAQGGSRIFNINDGFNAANDDVIIRNLSMTGGNSSTGGAIFNIEDLRLLNVTLEGNTSTGAGGAIRNESKLTVTGSTLFGNSAAQGGAISHSGGQASVFQSTISGNTASRGGGIDNYFGDVDIRYSTITQNQGGGTWSFGNSSYAEIRVKQSIISGNSGGDVNRHGNYTITTYSDGYNIVGDGGAAVLFNQPGDVITTDPQLRPLSDNGGPTLTHRPRLDSPAINAGDPAFAAAISEDQRGPGFDRVSDGRIDIGAVEANFLDLEVNTTSDVAEGGGGLTLRDAITMANAHNDPARITFDTAGVFSSPQTIAIANELPLITNDVIITGPGADALTIDAEGVAPRIFHLSSVEQVYAEISGLTLTGANGPATAGGGAILNREHLTATGLVITDNLSSTGGGILNSGNLTLLNSTLSGNTATGNGGAIYSSGTTDVQIINSTISGNTASGVGGGIRGAGYSNLVTIANSTFSNNSASTRGGGVDVVNAGLAIDNSIVAGNFAPSNPDITTTSTAGSYNLIGDGSGLGGFTGGNIGNQIGVADPGLAALADNGGPTPTHALLPGSPAINRGEPGFSGLLTDQRGESRVSGGIVDIGSVEAHPATVRDLGMLAEGATNETGQALRAQEVFFYRFELTEDVLAAAGDLFVIDTIGSSVNTSIPNDTEIGLFRADGTLFASNDAIDFNGSPQIIEAGLTFGMDSAQQTSEGDLPAGEYYLALTTFNSSFNSNFDVTRGDATATGTIAVNFNLVPGAVIDPDFNNDGNIDGVDINLLQANIVNGPADPATFDLTGDGQVTIADRDAWLTQAGAANLPSGNPYLLGDATLDGVVDGQDFIRWNNSKFTANSDWTGGDFNSDGIVDGQDFILWNNNKFTSADASAAGSNPTDVSNLFDMTDEDEDSRRYERQVDDLFAAFV